MRRAPRQDRKAMDGFTSEVIEEIRRQAARNISNVSIRFAGRGGVNPGLLVQEILRAGYLVDHISDHGTIEVNVPMELLPNEPGAEFGRCGTHGAALVPRKDPRLPAGPPFCPVC